MTTRPFRFGALTYQPFEGRTWADTARELEALGYASIALTDHFDAQHAPIPVAAAVTAATSTLVAATMMLANDFRHPLVLAKELATLDLMSEGRIEFGIGAGWKLTDYHRSGIVHDPAGVRIERLMEAIHIIRTAMSGEEFSFAGDHYTVRDYAALPLPHTPGGPRLAIGAGGRRLLTFAGRVADIVGINPNLGAGGSSVEGAQDNRRDRFAEKLGWVAEGAAEATDASGAGSLTPLTSDERADRVDRMSRIDDIEFTTIMSMVRVVTTAEQRAAAIAEASASLRLAEEDIVDMPTLLIGTVDEIVDALIERRERFGVSYVVVVPDATRAMAPIVERLSGR